MTCKGPGYPLRGRAVFFACGAVLAAYSPSALAAAAELPAVFGIPVDFILFGLTLLGVALFHHHTLYVTIHTLKEKPSWKRCNG
jgi:hypothetical protein